MIAPNGKLSSIRRFCWNSKGKSNSKVSIQEYYQIRWKHHKLSAISFNNNMRQCWGLKQLWKTSWETMCASFLPCQGWWTLMVTLVMSSSAVLHQISLIRSWVEFKTISYANILLVWDLVLMKEGLHSNRHRSQCIQSRWASRRSKARSRWCLSICPAIRNHQIYQTSTLAMQFLKSVSSQATEALVTKVLPFWTLRSICTAISPRSLAWSTGVSSVQRRAGINVALLSKARTSALSLRYRSQSATWTDMVPKTTCELLIFLSALFICIL